jgi:hypothetical protein
MRRPLRSLYTTTISLSNFAALIDIKNHLERDNLKSIQLLEKVKVVRQLIEGLGFQSVVDQQTAVSRDEFLTNFVCNVVDDETFKDHNRINELFELRKNHQISEEMDSKQVLIWTNLLLKQFSLAVRAVDNYGGGYRLSIENGLLELIQRKNKHGKFYQDAQNLLKQENEDGDPFIDEETGETLYQKKEKDTGTSSKVITTRAT